MDEEAVREEVRRAVEMARAELTGATAADDEPAEAGAAVAKAPRFSLSDWMNTEHDIEGPPVIVIKDTDGRVELAHVYDTLNRLACGDSAALLNYTPHSVTVGLPIRAVVPAKEDLAAAVESVFGRRCRVESDGVRISVIMGSDQDGKSSEDAA
jgi:hypothetical protein